MAENEDSNSKNGSLDFKKRRGIYVPVASTTIPPAGVLSSFWRWIGVGDKTLWNWLELLIVPLFLAGGAFYLERQTETRQEQIAAERYQQEEQIAANRYQQETLAKYLDQMTALLLDENLRESVSGSEARSIARARTVTTLQELDDDRKGLLIRFLHESNLISTNQTIVSLDGADLGSVNLSFAKLSGSNLGYAKLAESNLSYAFLVESNLSYAFVHSADLSDANLSDANLSYAFLVESNLSGANLSNADLSDAALSGADLRHANLSGADLSGADLGDADLSYANLSGADLSGARLSENNLVGTSLCGTIMPDRKVENQDCP